MSSRPRIRSLKPECWQDESVGTLSRDARLLFVGLITMADDEGRLRAQPSMLIGHIFPWDGVSPKKIAEWLLEIVAGDLVVYYEHDNKPYVAFRNWKRHQRINRPTPSELPAPPQSEIADANSVNESVIAHGAAPTISPDHVTPSRARGSDRIGSDREETTTPASGGESHSSIARRLFSHWQTICNHPQAKFTSDRKAKLEARLREGYTEQYITEAIGGAARAPFVNPEGKIFDDIELICRSGSKLEDFHKRTAPTGQVAAVVPAEFAKYDRAARRNEAA